MNNYIILGYMSFWDKLFKKVSILYIDTKENIIDRLIDEKGLVYKQAFKHIYSDLYINILRCSIKQVPHVCKDIMPKLDRNLCILVQGYTDFIRNDFPKILYNIKQLG